MKSNRTERLLEDIDNTIKSIQEPFERSPREDSFLAQFLVVFICGTFEEAIENILTEKIAQENSREINSFTSKYLDNHFRNPSIQKITDLLRLFSNDWADEIERLPAVIKDALNSIVTNKNHVAHGKSTYVTLNDVIEWYGISITVIERIDDMLLT